MRLLGIAGSVRRGSHNRKLLRAAAGALPPGAELALWERIGELPHFDEDLEAQAPPAPAQELRDAIAAADAVVIATPEYNAGMPGVLKNAIDWVSRPFDANPLRGKPLAVVGASSGLFGAVWAQAEVRRVAAHLGAEVLERELPIGFADGAFGGDGALADPAHAEALAAVVGELLERAREPAAETA